MDDMTRLALLTPLSAEGHSYCKTVFLDHEVEDSMFVESCTWDDRRRFLDLLVKDFVLMRDDTGPLNETVVKTPAKFRYDLFAKMRSRSNLQMLRFIRRRVEAGYFHQSALDKWEEIVTRKKVARRPLPLVLLAHEDQRTGPHDVVFPHEEELARGLCVDDDMAAILVRDKLINLWDKSHILGCPTYTSRALHLIDVIKTRSRNGMFRSVDNVRRYLSELSPLATKTEPPHS
jgi:hypothetical protein